MISREERYRKVLEYLAKECIPEGFQGLDLDLHEYACQAAMDRIGTEEIDDVLDEDYFEGLLLLVEAAIENEKK